MDNNVSARVQENYDPEDGLSFVKGIEIAIDKGSLHKDVYLSINELGVSTKPSTDLAEETGTRNKRPLNEEGG